MITYPKNFIICGKNKSPQKFFFVLWGLLFRTTNRKIYLVCSKTIGVPTTVTTKDEFKFIIFFCFISNQGKKISL